MNAAPPPIAFEPVPLRGRRDGWTAERQRQFIALIASGMPSNHAASAVGMSKQSAHLLRRRPGAEEFARAWDSAAQTARRASRGKGLASVEAAVNGLREPVIYRGKVRGFTIRYDNRTLARLLGQAYSAGLLDPPAGGEYFPSLGP